MSWSETMFILQHFYNVFDINDRLEAVEYKSPLVAEKKSDSENEPKLPDGTLVTDLTPGTLWFIKDSADPTMISAVSILKDDHTFEESIPFKIDLKKIPIEEDLKQIATTDMQLELTDQNYHDIIKLILETLKTVPVKYGGTGRTSIAQDKILVGNGDNTFKEIGFDNTPTANSQNLVNSGALNTQIQKLSDRIKAFTVDGTTLKIT